MSPYKKYGWFMVYAYTRGAAVGGDNFVVSVKNISVTNILTFKIGISETLFLCAPLMTNMCFIY